MSCTTSEPTIITLDVLIHLFQSKAINDHYLLDMNNFGIYHINIILKLQCLLSTSHLLNFVSVQYEWRTTK